ncbi:hypothetical protein SISNIDRAFT_547625 [Sistotremastrum niveocremeum HHB9708]|uniref:Uncharacterized protein n=2 Tax=Sistotremastraceae TaxID=3402574 RepID=A0A164YIT8_9AGAM|nr:hypothetical protein SISNIDRAFT_547625 [Sistotremastrum niveocremeum HHB9708]KZT43378.1 hypothetical protein SISSUDRAFT_1116433 [Sistotremastrum suecicum HHB10207 ss-3]
MSSPPAFDSSRVSANLSDEEIERHRRELRSAMDQNAETIKEIAIFSDTTIGLKKSFTDTKAAVEWFESHRTQKDHGEKLSTLFDKSVKNYSALVESAQDAARTSKSDVFDTYLELIVPMLKEPMSDKEIVKGINDFVASIPSHADSHSLQILDQLKGSLETFSKSFSTSVSESDIVDVDINAATQKVDKLTKEHDELETKIRKLLPKYLKSLELDGMNDELTFYLEIAPLVLVKILTKGIRGAKDISDLLDALNRFTRLKTDIVTAENERKNIIQTKIKADAQNAQALKAQANELQEKAFDVGKKLSHLTSMLRPVKDNLAAYSKYLDGGKIDPVEKQRRIDQIEMSATLLEPVSTALGNFAARI